MAFFYILLILLIPKLYANDFIVKLNDIDQKSIKNLRKMGELSQVTPSFPSLFHLKTKLTINKVLELKSSNIEYIEPNYRYYPLSTPQDPLFKKQWGLHNPKRKIDINILRVWDNYIEKREIIIAIIDSGIDIHHPDLKDNLWANDTELNGIEGIDDDSNGYIDDIYGYDFLNNKGLDSDEMGHGTHCAGVIGASHNSIGIAGVMPKVKLMGLKFFNGDGGSTLDAIRSIAYAIENGAHILSNSWGGTKKSKALEEIIKYAHSKNIPFIAAAGNSSGNNDKADDAIYPASYQLDNIISVGAITHKGKKAYFSNYGKKSVHLFAPGNNILSTVQYENYLKMSGTSMATPFVAGAVGLLLNEFPELSSYEVKKRLLNSANKIKGLQNKCISGGYLDTMQLIF